MKSSPRKEATVGSIVSSMLDIATQIQGLTGKLEKDIDRLKCERKYGYGLIRVDWQYAKNAFKNAHLRHVCTWPNGDEGFVPKVKK